MGGAVRLVVEPHLARATGGREIEVDVGSVLAGSAARGYDPERRGVAAVSALGRRARDDEPARERHAPAVAARRGGRADPGVDRVTAGGRAAEPGLVHGAWAAVAGAQLSLDGDGTAAVQPDVPARATRWCGREPDGHAHRESV